MAVFPAIIFGGAGRSTLGGYFAEGVTDYWGACRVNKTILLA